MFLNRGISTTWESLVKGPANCLWVQAGLLCLQVNSRTIDDRVLKLTVYDVDRHKRHNVIGHALYPLRDHDCLLEGRLVVWRDLEREVSEVGDDGGGVVEEVSEVGDGGLRVVQGGKIGL